MTKDSHCLEQLRQRHVEEWRVAKNQIEYLGQVRRTIQIRFHKSGQIRKPSVDVQHANRPLPPVQLAPDHRRAQTAGIGKHLNHVRQLLQRLLVEKVLLTVMMFLDRFHLYAAKNIAAMRVGEIADPMGEPPHAVDAMTGVLRFAQ